MLARLSTLFVPAFVTVSTFVCLPAFAHVESVTLKDSTLIVDTNTYDFSVSAVADNSFAKQAGVIDYSSPALHLASLTPEELYILLKNLRHVYAEGDEEKYLVPDESLKAFLQHCSQTIGDAYFRTPRNTIKAFLDMLAVIDQNPQIAWHSLISSVAINEDKPSDVELETEDNEDGFADFKL